MFSKIRLLQLVAAGEGAVKRRLVGILEAAAHGQAVGQTGRLDAEGLDELGQIHGGSLPPRRWDSWP